MQAIPVIALTGYLGAGKTIVLNHVLRSPGARIGVVINDFGELNVDAGLVTGQVDEPASIAGGCICCLPDEGGLDIALARLADPKLRLDAIIVEASGLADPVAISRIIRFSGVDGVRQGGVVDVLDAATHFDTVDRDATAPARYGAATVVVVNKLDQVAESERAAALRRIERRVRERNPHAPVVGATAGRIDPSLLYDVSVAVRYRATTRTYAVNVVGPSIHIATAPPGAVANGLVAIGMCLDVDEAGDRRRSALSPVVGAAPAQGIRRLQRYRRLSI